MKKNSLFLIQALIVLSLALVVGCCKKDDKGNDILQVGQKYQGGIIAYVDDTGKHGLIAAPSDQSTGIRWNNDSFFGVTTATGTEIGTGKNNTDRIVQMQGDGAYAAKLCHDLVIDSYNDWFLPSMDELNMLYQNRLKIGGFVYKGAYWSSSEYNGPFGSSYEDGGTYAFLQEFYGGYQYFFFKSSTCRVRAVRAF